MPEFEKQPKDAPDCAMKYLGEIVQFKPIPEHDKNIYPDSLKRKLIHGYYAGVSYMDTQLGRVIDELDRLDMADNTITVLWGDHGWHLGDHGIWTKHTNYEQVNHIPLEIVAPGITKPNSKTNHMTETVDIYPTLANLVGLDAPDVQQPIDGNVLTKVLKDSDARVDNHVHHAYDRSGYMGEAIRTERYRMVRWTNMKDPKDVLFELHDYDEDPQETINIAAKNKKKVEELTEILESYPKAKYEP